MKSARINKLLETYTVTHCHKLVSKCFSIQYMYVNCLDVHSHIFSFSFIRMLLKAYEMSGLSAVHLEE